MYSRCGNEKRSFQVIVLFLAIAGMIAPAWAQAEAILFDGAANKYLDEGGRSSDYIVDHVHAAGFTEVYFVAFEHDHYNIKARDPDGNYVEIQLDPVTGTLLTDPQTGKPRLKPVTRAKPDEAIPSWEDIITQVKAEGYVEVYSIEYEHALYEIIVRDAQNRVIELWGSPGTGKLLRHPATGKPLYEVLE